MILPSRTPYPFCSGAKTTGAIAPVAKADNYLKAAEDAGVKIGNVIGTHMHADQSLVDGMFQA